MEGGNIMYDTLLFYEYIIKNEFSQLYKQSKLRVITRLNKNI